MSRHTARPEIRDSRDPRAGHGALVGGAEQREIVIAPYDPSHWMLRTPARDVHIHIWADPADVHRHLLFRDWLRTHPSDRLAYEQLKVHLARHDWDTTNDYAAAKTPFIDEIVSRAMSEARAS